MVDPIKVVNTDGKWTVELFPYGKMIAADENQATIMEAYLRRAMSMGYFSAQEDMRKAMGVKQ